MNTIIDTSHIVLSMLRVKNGKLINFFKKHGITYNKYKETLEQFKSGLTDLDYELKRIEDLLKNQNFDMSTSDDFGDVFEDNNKKKEKN